MADNCSRIIYSSVLLYETAGLQTFLSRVYFSRSPLLYPSPPAFPTYHVWHSRLRSAPLQYLRHSNTGRRVPISLHGVLDCYFCFLFSGCYRAFGNFRSIGYSTGHSRPLNRHGLSLKINTRITMVEKHRVFMRILQFIYITCLFVFSLNICFNV